MKKVAYLALAFAMGCSESAEPSVAPIGATRSQLEAFDALEANTQLAWQWIQHDEFGTPAHLSAPRIGEPILRDADPIATTLALLAEHRALFKMHDPNVELASSRVHVDELGMTHARFQQLAHGVPVAGAELMAHYDKEGRLTSIDANYVSDLDDVDVNPAIDVSAARAIAEREGVAVDDGRLLLYVRSGEPTRLAYEFKGREIGEHPAIWVITVDAKTGRILHRYDNLQTVQATGTGVLGDEKTFEVSAATGGYEMVDASGGVEIRTFSASYDQITPGAIVTSENQNAWDTIPPGAGAAVDAHVNASTVFKYYKQKHDRNALDGKGSALVSTTHFGKSYENAAWDGKGMVYGDGGNTFRPLSVALDVCGHEFTHGVTENSSGLTYENQPGALNEAVSDIFGAFIEHWMAPDPVKNWTIGEQVMKQGRPLRDMANPGNVDDAQPAHMSRYINTQQDNGGIHANSGIINNAAYLMTVGGTNSISKIEVKNGIGWEKSEKLWYRANTKYFMSKTKFATAAQNVMQAAKDIGLSSAEIATVDCAFKATGVVDGACSSGDSEPSTATPTSDGDSSADTTAKRRRVIRTGSSCNAAGVPRSSFGLALGALAVLATLRRSRKRC